MNQAPRKKCRVGNGDPNLRSQPRLPGSVVGEPSMRQGPKADKITRGHCPLVTATGRGRNKLWKPWQARTETECPAAGARFSTAGLRGTRGLTSAVIGEVFDHDSDLFRERDPAPLLLRRARTGIWVGHTSGRAGEITLRASSCPRAI